MTKNDQEKEDLKNPNKKSKIVEVKKKETDVKKKSTGCRYRRQESKRVKQRPGPVKEDHQ